MKLVISDKDCLNSADLKRIFMTEMKCAVVMQPNQLVEQLKGITMRSSLTDSKVPEGRAKTTFVHEGGCYALAFDRYAQLFCTLLSLHIFMHLLWT